MTWKVTEPDALDRFTLASLLHRRFDSAVSTTPNKVVNPGGGSGCTFPTSLHRWNCWERMLVHDNTTYS